jgi:MFS family permease
MLLAMHTNGIPKAWYRELSGYHWFVFIVCTLGWMFDCFDQQLFNIARQPAISETTKTPPGDPAVAQYAGYATSFMLIGWATGGILFGIMGDRYGRARTMVFTILTYSVFTGLSGLAITVWDFLFYRFLTGLGVGGQFSVGVALVAETLPDRARPHALGLLQAFSALGNVCAALVGLLLEHMVAQQLLPGSAWRWMFLVGILPSLLVILIVRKLREPEAWRRAVAVAPGERKAGSLKELFGDPRWRRHTIVGMLLASAGVIGLWGIGFFSIDLNRTIFRKRAEQQARQAGEAEWDRLLICRLLSAPELLDNLDNQLKPQDLLSQEADNKDPQVIYATALTLRKQQQAVSRAAVLEALDRPDPKANRPAQSPADRQRRQEYLAEAAAAEEVAPAPTVDATVPTTTELVQQIIARQKRIGGEVGWWGSITSMLFNLGAFLGVYAFSRVTHRLGRRPTFVLFFLAAMVATVIAFLYMNEPHQVFWMVPVMGFFQLSVFGGYAIYFPELFPTRLRSTGTSFCYNIGRYVAALGPSALGILTSVVFAGHDEPMRYAGVTMSAIFLLGVVVVAFGPETKGKPLPE